jgi:hypothetical protein
VKGARITGRIVFEGVAPSSARAIVEASSSEPWEGVAMMGAAAGSSLSVPTKPDGTFTLTGIVGRRELTVNTRLIPGWRVKSITAGGRDLLNLPLDFAGGEDLRDVLIVLTQQTSELTGRSPTRTATRSVAFQCSCSLRIAGGSRAAPAGSGPTPWAGSPWRDCRPATISWRSPTRSTIANGQPPPSSNGIARRPCR